MIPATRRRKLPQRLSNDLAGKVALVIGGNRGSGAEITRCLVSHGSIVFTTSRSSGVQNGVTTFSGSAVDAAWLKTVRDAIQKQHGKLDFLICNAFPAINPLRMESNAIARIQAYLQQATALVLNPLCLFMGMLDASGGRVVIVSSTATQRPVRENGLTMSRRRKLLRGWPKSRPCNTLVYKP